MLGGKSPSTHYQFPDPTDEAMRAAFDTLYRRVFHDVLDPTPPTDVMVNRLELQRVLSLAQGYLDLGTYELGTNAVLEKLRAIRAALRKFGRAE